MSSKIRVAVAGVGNCASSLIQGVAWYRANPDKTVGLMHPRLAGYGIDDIEFVAAFDIDARKVGRPLQDAIFAMPNNTKDICRPLPATGVTVQMAPILDGFPDHMREYPEHLRFVSAAARPCDVARVLAESGAEILLNYLPVGSQKATEFYAQMCLETGVSLVNCIPVFIVSEQGWAEKFRLAGIPCVGDDVKAQLGATITHRTLARLFVDRGMVIDSTYQLNTGGNTDFLNMLNRSRLASKKISKTEAVQSQLDIPLDAEHIHIGPADFVPFQKDNKVCFLRLEARGFADVPMNLELRLSVEDSPNSAGVVCDAIRCCRLARDRGLSGPLEAISAWTMKHPPTQFPDTKAHADVETFIAG